MPLTIDQIAEIVPFLRNYFWVTIIRTYLHSDFITTDNSAWTDGAGRDGDQVEGQDEGEAEEGRALQLEEDRQDGHQVSQEAEH